METRFLVIFTFLVFETFVAGVTTPSSNVTCKEMERRSLLIFKQRLTDTHNILSTWRGLECCEWHGVGCDSRNGQVVKLDLRTPVPLNETILFNDKLLEGELSPSLQNLKHLRYLDLSMNRFSGNIPEFLGSFRRLEYLNLSGSFSSGVVPHHLGNLSRLHYLDLKSYFVLEQTYTTSTGGFKFPETPVIDDLGWVSSLSSLRYLDLSGITIDKHIDWFHPVNMIPSLLTLRLAFSDISIVHSVKANVINFTSLNSLDVSYNDINSTIPVWLSNLTSLMHLNLNRNHFHGKIPSFFGMYNNLASIDLSSNSFDTPMPDMLCNSSNLVHLDLSRNMFSGSIPASLGLLLRLQDVYLNDNELSGNIPKSLGQLTNLKNLDLSYNSFVGVLSETHFNKLNNLDYLSLSSNSLVLDFSAQWIAPFQLRIFFASSCKIGPRFPNWLQTQTNIKMLDLSNSSIIDTIPEWFENILSRILYLDLSNNRISGKLPLFDFNIGNQREGGILKMNSNKFEGSLALFPSNVNLLDLSDNLLSGHIPPTNETMNPNLEVVNLSRNRFTGSVPTHLCKVPSILVLDLSQNKFLGRLPECLENLIYLQAMDLSNNNITGVVPGSLGSLQLLMSLHLNNNRFEGYLPMSLKNMAGLVTMDLANNFFVGSIPSWIGEKIHYLQFLNLQSNKFTGKIPLQLCKLDNLQYLSVALNNITGTIPHCLGNIRGMITALKTYAIPVFYEENILAFMKGRELLYTKTVHFLTSLDLSSNNIVGEIPDALMHLVGLTNLNLSQNLLKGWIPSTIGDLKQLESLDLSRNKLSGRIPQSLTSLHFLSYLNLSFNNLSGAIPVGNQIQTIVDPSIYEGNIGLCGPPVSRSCNVNHVKSNHFGDDQGQDDDEGLWFYEGMGPGFVVGFVGLLGSLPFIKRWRAAKLCRPVIC